MLINGRNAVLEALRTRQGVQKVFVMYGLEGEPVDRVRIEAKRAGVPCVTIDRKRFGEMERDAGVHTRSQGVLALLDAIDYVDLDLLVQSVFDQGRMPLVAALDGVTDPHNVGAVIRSAECAGFDGLLIGKNDSASITDVVMKTSAGAVNHLPIDRASNIGDVLLSLQQAGLAIVGLDERGDMSYVEYDFTAPTAIVIGSEGKGMGHRIRKICDHRLSIPMLGRIASLNASVAAGVVFFEAQRQRGFVLKSSDDAQTATEASPEKSSDDAHNASEAS